MPKRGPAATNRSHRPLESLGMKKMRQTAPMGAVGCTIEVDQDSKMEILADT